MTLIHPQLPLGFEPGELYTFDSLVKGPNRVLVEMAMQIADGKGETQLFVWGASGSGKSHLLQACCNRAAHGGATVCFLTVEHIRVQATEMLEGMEQLDLVCLDDVDQWLREPGWDVALFGLINRVRESGHRIIMSASIAPDDSFVSLPDLRSRLSWGPVFQIAVLSDEDKYLALQYRARQNGLDLPGNVAEYLVQRYPRDMFGLFERLALLDRAAMATKRRLTIPLVKQVLESTTAAVTSVDS